MVCSALVLSVWPASERASESGSSMAAHLGPGEIINAFSVLAAPSTPSPIVLSALSGIARAAAGSTQRCRSRAARSLALISSAIECSACTVRSLALFTSLFDGGGGTVAVTSRRRHQNTAVADAVALALGAYAAAIAVLSDAKPRATLAPAIAVAAPMRYADRAPASPVVSAGEHAVAASKSACIPLHSHSEAASRPPRAPARMLHATRVAAVVSTTRRPSTDPQASETFRASLRAAMAPCAAAVAARAGSVAAPRAASTRSAPAAAASCLPACAQADSAPAALSTSSEGIAVGLGWSLHAAAIAATLASSPLLTACAFANSSAPCLPSWRSQAASCGDGASLLDGCVEYLALLTDATRTLSSREATPLELPCVAASRLRAAAKPSALSRAGISSPVAARTSAWLASVAATDDSM
mmetsp:Transcript_9346/g.38312  ORF Transcript_9346/g.38312 Transcript_9346/m.38312 type:complete len:415 (+) Transcript_9346:1390-2634(+)